MPNHISKSGASKQVCEYIVDCESSEYDNYTEWCNENDLNPIEIRGFKQSTHVYALALIALGMEYPTDCTHKDIDKHNQCLECNADLTESIAAHAHDKAKDRRKYGD